MTTAHLAVTTGLPPAPDTSNVPPPPTPAPKEHLAPKPLPNGSFDPQNTPTASATSTETRPTYAAPNQGGHAHELFASAIVIGAASVVLLVVALVLVLIKKHRTGSL